ncbi:MAG: DUF5050 domain-containing protein [Clostridiales bacterium]|jgi:hypothetical protein|nr:DUF5050 domain-containing protein [Clostridiales bacterium]
MALEISLYPFTLKSVISSDPFLTHYHAEDAEGAAYVVTEFNPVYMTSRADTGDLKVEPRFSEEFVSSLEKFVQMAESMRDLHDVPIPKIEDIRRQNNTAYVVRKPNTYDSLVAYLKEKQMPIEDAYDFIRPLILILSQAEHHNLHFKITEDDMHVNHYGQLMMDCLFTWDTTFRTTVTDLIHLFYRMLHGQPYSETPPPDAPPLAKVPPKLAKLMDGILKGDVLYGSVDDFYKQFKSVANIKREVEKVDTEEKTRSSMKTVIAVLAALVFFSLLFLFVINVLIPVFRRTTPALADASQLTTGQSVSEGTSEAEQPGALLARNFSAFTATDPADPGNMLEGSYYVHEGVEYYRLYNNGRYQLVSRDGGTERVLADGVRPSFIACDDGYVYFCDTLNNYGVYRVKDTGEGGAQRLTGNCASFLRVDGGFLYYTNHDDRDRLYRINLEAPTEAEAVVKTAAYGTVIHEGRFYFVNGGQGYRLYTAAPGENGEQTPLNDLNCDNLRMHDGKLYYINVEDGEIYCSTPEGGRVDFTCPVKARQFEIDGRWMVIVEAETFALTAFNLDTGETRKLGNGQQFAYAGLQAGGVYAISYDDGSKTRWFELI